MWRWYEILDDIDGRGQIRIRFSAPGTIPATANHLFAIFSGSRLAIGQPLARLSYTVVHDTYGSVIGVRVRDYDRIDSVVSPNNPGLAVCSWKTWAGKERERVRQAGDTTHP